MLRALLLCSGFVCVAWLQYEFAPGHSYLEGETQIYVPVLERLSSPGFLTRDLVATHPAVTYTTYDEVTLALHDATRRDFQTVLRWQQLLSRLASLIGVYALAVSTGIAVWPSFVLAAVVNFGAYLPGVGVNLVEREPVPRAFAIGWTVLALGLISRKKPLLAGLAGGIAMLYHPPAALTFWGPTLMICTAVKRLRPLLRPLITVLCVFGLLLANFTQLQPGIGEHQQLLGRIPKEAVQVQLYRTPAAWVSTWAPRLLLVYLGLWACALWATTRFWRALDDLGRSLFVALPALGILAVPFSYLLLEIGHWILIPQIQPARALLFTVLFTAVSSGAAAVVEFRRGRKLVSAALAIVVIAIAANSAAGRPRVDNKLETLQLASWAEENTWGSSLFLFPDAGRAMYPGVFRAASRRALYVDWESGSLAALFPSLAAEWWLRWQTVMARQFGAAIPETLLSLPIDYYVLKREHELSGVAPAYRNRAFVVYDATDLRNRLAQPAPKRSD